jgi:hemerythrin
MSAPEKAAAVSPFEWRSELLLNVDQIDRQHQELLARARTLNEALNAAAPPHEIEAKLSDLIGFTEMHFGSEEEAMRAHGYEGYATHQAVHRKLLDQIHLVKRDLLNGTVVPCQMLTRFMQAWTNHHITNLDKQLATFLRSKSDA